MCAAPAAGASASAAAAAAAGAFADEAPSVSWCRLSIEDEDEDEAEILLELLKDMKVPHSTPSCDSGELSPFYVQLDQDQLKRVARKIRKDAPRVRLDVQEEDFVPDDWDDGSKWEVYATHDYVQAMRDGLADALGRMALEDQPPGVYCEYPHCLHIDVRLPGGLDRRARGALNRRLARHINEYMISRFYYDPRRYANFLDATPDGQGLSLAELRAMANVAGDYYELWRVKGGFDMQAFFHSFDQPFAQDNYIVQVCAMFEAQTQNFRWPPA
jgi:hypothetical protein